jgi:alcohol dehydrogenase class IV
MTHSIWYKTKVFFGKNALEENKGELLSYGKKAFIVTGGSSAKKSGAYDDIINVLSKLEIEFEIFNEVENNPSVENVGEGGRRAREFGADFIIGIGGGSPLDASKAIAVLAANDIPSLELYNGNFKNEPKPIIAIPTTAGTGSEVTQYSILTRKDKETKMGIGGENLFPKLAFVDPKYTNSLPYQITINTGIDALSHAVEGYLSKRSIPYSDALAEKAIKFFGECLNDLTEDNITETTREKLMYLSMLAGIVIAHTGTTIVHAMGYSLTYFHDIPHGKANGILLEEYLKFNYSDAKEKIDNIINLLGVSSIEDFGNKVKQLIDTKVEISADEIDKYAEKSFLSKNAKNNIVEVTKEDLIGIIRNSIK